MSTREAREAFLQVMRENADKLSDIEDGSGLRPGDIAYIVEQLDDEAIEAIVAPWHASVLLRRVPSLDALVSVCLYAASTGYGLARRRAQEESINE